MVWKSNMAALKQEVVITLVVYQIEVRFQVLVPCFQGWPMQWNIDRHRMKWMKFFSPFCRQFIYRKSHQGIPTNSQWLRSGSQKIGLGGEFYPPDHMRVRGRPYMTSTAGGGGQPHVDACGRGGGGLSRYMTSTWYVF